MNLGYGFDAADSGMTSVAVLVTSTFIELGFEVVVDAFALDVEAEHVSCCVCGVGVCQRVPCAKSGDRAVLLVSTYIKRS